MEKLAKSREVALARVCCLILQTGSLENAWKSISHPDKLRQKEFSELLKDAPSTLAKMCNWCSWRDREGKNSFQKILRSGS